MDDHRVVWDTLGDWQVAPPPDLTERVLQAVHRSKNPPKRFFHIAAFQYAARVAAAIIVAVVAGYSGGRLSVPTPRDAPAPSVVSHEMGSAALRDCADILHTPAVGLANCLIMSDSSCQESTQ